MTKEELFHLQLSEYPGDLYRTIKENWNRVAKPLDGLGVLEEMLCSIGAAQGSEEPSLNPREIIIMCADNGIVEEGVSQSGQEVTLAVARNMGLRKSSVCKMAQKVQMKVTPVDIGINSTEQVPGVANCKVAMGTRNFLREPAMTEEEVLKAIETGMDLVHQCSLNGIKLLATGEMGIGNTTTSAAVAAALLSEVSDRMAGRGAGLDDQGLARKIRVIREGLLRYGFLQNSTKEDSDQEQALKALRCLGGLDIAGLCGVFLGAALYHIPVIIDGVISATAALCAHRILPGSERCFLASHIGEEPAMQYLLSEMGLKPVIHAGLKLGEGTGAVMLVPMLDMALEVYEGSSSFRDIGVAQYERYSS